MVEQEDGVVERKQWTMQEGKWRRRERELWFLVPLYKLEWLPLTNMPTK
jgi:hypothetical protein